MTLIKQNKLFPLCASLALHLLVAAIFVFGLYSGPAVFSPDFNKLNLVWVSLDTKAGNSPAPAARDSKQQKQLTTINAVAAAETLSIQNPQPEIKAVAVVPDIVAYSKNVVSAKPGIHTTALAGNNHFSGSVQTTTAAGVGHGYSNAAPLYRDTPPPVYPGIAKLRGYEGIVWVSAEILPDGRVGNTRIMRSSGYAILDQSALDAVKPWKFEPARKAGEPYTKWVDIPIKFVLHDANQQS